MSHRSAPELRLLHAVRVLGFADDAAITSRADTGGETVGMLLAAEHRGWVREYAFADLGGWSLTDDGRAENERQLALERSVADPDGTIAAAYREFLPLNARLVRACTDWQVRPAAADRLVPNDHSDAGWDTRILTELAALRDALVPLTARLTAVLARFAGYDVRFAAALRRAADGHPEWVDTTGVDSCHRVWFELHEDLVATLGIDRRTELS